MRSFDQRNHAYSGFALFLHGKLDGTAREFSVGIGPGAQAKHAFRAGATRMVPGRNGMTWEEEDWVDEEATSSRGPDE